MELAVGPQMSPCEVLSKDICIMAEMCWTGMQAYKAVGPSAMAPRPAPPPQYIVGNQLMIPTGKRRGRPPKQQVVVPTPDQLKYRTADTSSLAAMGATGGITISPGQLITSSGPMPTPPSTSGGSSQGVVVAAPLGVVGIQSSQPINGASSFGVPSGPSGGLPYTSATTGALQGAQPLGPSRLGTGQQGSQGGPGVAEINQSIPQEGLAASAPAAPAPSSGPAGVTAATSRLTWMSVLAFPLPLL